MKLRALLFAAAVVAVPIAALAAGALQQQNIQDGTGRHSTYMYDMSGTGVGPWVPVVVAVDSTGTPIGSASGSGLSGLSPPTRLVSSAATTNLTAISSSAIHLYRVRACNTVATARYLKFYNVASGSVTVGATAVTDSVLLGASQCTSVEFGAAGEFFNTALSFALTAGNADADTTALAVGDVVQLAVFAQ